jgi:signal transduction histidine kinase
MARRRTTAESSGYTILVVDDQEEPLVSNRLLIVQEALTNVARHAAATQVSVVLRHSTTRLTVQVTDNGKGFDLARVSDSCAVGLVGMQERARLIGGMS